MMADQCITMEEKKKKDNNNKNNNNNNNNNNGYLPFWNFLCRSVGLSPSSDVDFSVENDVVTSGANIPQESEVASIDQLDRYEVTAL